MKSKFSVWISISAMALAFSACGCGGSGSGSNPSSAGDATTTAATTTTTVSKTTTLSLNPPSSNVSAGASIQFTASGGSSPYLFAVSAGTGSINTISGLYTAAISTSASTATVAVRDSLGSLAYAVISIAATPSTGGSPTPYSPTTTVMALLIKPPCFGTYSINSNSFLGTESASLYINAGDSSGNFTGTVISNQYATSTVSGVCTNGNISFNRIGSFFGIWGNYTTKYYSGSYWTNSNTSKINMSGSVSIPEGSFSWNATQW